MDTRYLGMQFFMIHSLRRRMVQRRTAGFDLRHGQLPLLEAVMQHPDSTQQELADRLCVSPASIAQSAARLSREGFLEKHVDPKNKRCNRLTATEAGMQAAHIYRLCFDEVNEYTFSGLTEAQQEQLSELLGMVLEHFQEDADDCRICRAVMEGD